MADEKIIAKETLDDKDLDQVTGGNAWETYDDTEYLHKFYGVDFSGVSTEEKLKKLFAGVGIGFIAHDNEPNEYYDMLMGQPIARGVALDEAGRKFKEEQQGPLFY